ncbi:calmodulin-regulated spectrin-associated protein 2 [Gadus macrocephalus]|uniref:calmodulin-regulated spectrin-associated protein 2 n=1 Tax=Gadus macrocephalus TaxID=80720 RepID=UPI0028CB603E|nr:calmodulin-regulated spectrin-associated protein 2 [Gadus macrocephalus]
MSDAADGPGMRRTFIVPTITSFDHYDFTRAKIKCSLTWLVAKAFGSDAVPEELAEPFYLDQYAQEHLKPPVACLLQSAELYCRAGSLILRSDAVKPLLGHNAVIQALAQKCLYVTDQDRLVTERDLTGSPIHMSSHLALIDALMMAYTDSLPRLRRFSPSQTQTSSFAYLGHDEGPLALDSLDPQDPLDPQQRDKHPEEGPRQSAGALRPPAKGADAEPDPGERREVAAAGKATEGVISSEVRCQPGADHQGHGRRQGTAEQSDPGRRDLREVPLFQKDNTEEEAALDGGAGRDAYGDDQKMCCGFFFKDDAKGQEDMAAKREALLEKRLRREKEAQEKKVQQEQEQEEKKEAARLRAEEELQKKDDEKARRDYIKNEYLRRKQLKLMDDMNDVIKPRSGSLKKKPRPKSIHRDVVESPKPPVRAAGARPRGYSVSSVSLASLNLGDNDSNQSDNRKTPRGNKVASCHISFFLSSPKERKGRPDSAGGFSSCPSAGSRNGEKDWEIESTTSSTPSNTEYTGPKLYKEPSAKSNKHIIQNALAHCCLAGKVNEGQKNKILDEMEKSEANNFLVLFRDAGCQFRSVYTYCPESEEMTKLAGIGPKSITTKMVEGLYKYNSDRKQFSHIPAKTMSASVDAVTIASHLWQTKKQSTPKKLQPK